MSSRAGWFLRLILIASATLRAAGPVLDTAQIDAAIKEGERYKSIDKFLEHGLKGRKIQIAGAMTRDGISKYATFFNDFEAVAAEAAAAHQQMRTLKVEDIHSDGLLHVFVEVQGAGIVGVSRLDRQYQGDRAHFVLQINDRVIQPTAKEMVKQSNVAGASIAWGTTMRKITLRFAFDVSPEDLRGPIQIILIDGDGNKHTESVNLNGVLDY